MPTKKDKTRISVCAKTSDCWSHTIFGKDGSIQSTYDGYVPSFMPGEHFGDYVMLEIDPYTGVILNWNKWKRAKTKKKVRGSK